MRSLLLFIILFPIGNNLHAQQKKEIIALNKAKQRQYEVGVSQYENTNKGEVITEAVGCVEYKIKGNKILSQKELETYEVADKIDCRIHIYCNSGVYMGWYVSDQYEKKDLVSGQTQVYCNNGNLLATYRDRPSVKPQINKLGSTTVANVYPNPFNQKIHFNLYSQEEQGVGLVLIDMEGRTIRNETIRVHKGDQQLTLSLSENIPAGLYYFRISDAKGQQLHVEKLEHISNN